MSNPYFTFSDPAVAGTTIRASKYNADQQALETAFDEVDDKLNQAVFLPSTFSGNPNIPEQTVENTFIYIDASGNIALYPIQSFLDAFALVEAQYNQIEAWRIQVAEDAVEAQDSAELAAKFATEAEDVLVTGTEYSARHWALKSMAQVPLVTAAGQAKVDLAQSYANGAKNVQVEAGLYSAKHYSLVAADQIPLVTAAGQAKVDEAQTKVDDADAQATLAKNYANANKNVQVETGFYSSKHYSLVAADQIPLVEAAGQAKVDDAQAQVALATTQANNAATQANNAASSATKSDNFANYAHNQLVPNSGGKYSAYHWSKEAEAYAQQTLDAVNGDFVPNTRTVNGKPLSSNIILGTADIQGLSTVATSGSYDDLTNKPTAADVGAAAASHAHADYVVKNSNAILNHLTTNGGATFKDRTVIIDTGTNSLTIQPATANGYSGLTFASDAGVTRWLLYTTDDANADISLQGRDNNGAYQHTSLKIKRSTGDVEFLRPITIQGSTPYHTGNLPNPVQTGDLANVATSGSYNDLSNKPTTTSLGAVPTGRTINGKALSSNITLNATDVSALPNTTTLATLGGVPTGRTVNGKALSSNITLNAADVSALPNTTTLATLGGVPTSRQVNGKALTGNITLNASDVSALPSTEKATKISRVSGSFTATRLAGITEYIQTGTGNATCTVNDTAFGNDEKLVIHKQVQSGQLNIVSGEPMYVPDGTNGTSHVIPAGIACTVELIFTGTSSLLRVYR